MFQLSFVMVKKLLVGYSHLRFLGPLLAQALIVSNFIAGSGEQFNGITAFVDASNVYGSNKLDGELIRDRKPPGHLSVSPHPKDANGNNNNLLPEVDADPNNFRFRAGDSRAPEMPGLLSMHTIWMREHNRIGMCLGKKRAKVVYLLWLHDTSYLTFHTRFFISRFFKPSLFISKFFIS